MLADRRAKDQMRVTAIVALQMHLLVTQGYVVVTQITTIVIPVIH